MSRLSSRRPLPISGQQRRVLDRSVAILGAMAHPTRLMVLHALAENGPLPVGQLQQIAGTEQTALSHQLRVLRKADLVRATRSGRRILYDLKDHHVAHIVEDSISHARETANLSGAEASP